MNKKKLFGVFFLLCIILIIIFFLFFYFNQADEEGSSGDVGDSQTLTSIGLQDPFNLENIPLSQNLIPFEGVDLDEEIGTIVDRDDRVFDDFIFEEDSSEFTGIAEERRLVRLFKGPTAAYRVIQGTNEGSFTIQLVEQGQGNRYTIATDPYTINQVSEGEFSKVQDAEIFSNGSTLLMYESSTNELDIQSAFVPFRNISGGSSIQIFESNIRTTTNNGNLLFFIKEINDIYTGFVVDVENPGNTEVVWESGFSSWLPRWGRNGFITVQTPISSQLDGLVYVIDPTKENEPVKFLSSEGGGVFIDSISQFFVLHSISSGEFVGKTVITNREREETIEIPVTIPEKCDGFNGSFICAVPDAVESTTNSGKRTDFPDSWYQGDLTFEDSLILVDVTTEERKVLLSKFQSDFFSLTDGQTFDIVDLYISEDGTKVFFLSREDLSLWMLDITASL